MENLRKIICKTNKSSGQTYFLEFPYILELKLIFLDEYKAVNMTIHWKIHKKKSKGDYFVYQTEPILAWTYL